MCSPGQGKMGPLAPFACGWLVPGRTVSWTVSFPKVLPPLSLLLWLSAHLIEACVAAKSMEGSCFWILKIRGVVQEVQGWCIYSKCAGLLKNRVMGMNS